MSNLSPQLQRCYDLALRGAWHHPFFLIPLGHVEWLEGDPEKIQTMQVHSRITGKGSDAKPEIKLYINPEWTKGIPDDQIFGCLAHEIMHSMMRHHERCMGKDLKTWGEAADMAINSALVQSGIKLPQYALLPPRDHADDAAEELYTLLVQEEIPKLESDAGKVGEGCMPDGQDPGEGRGDGDGEPGDQDGGSQAGDRVWGEMVAQAQQAARGTGSAKALAKIFTAKPPGTKWAQLLRSAANRATARGGRDQQSYKRINRRSGDIILPGWQSNRPSVAVMIDSSGSVDDDMLASALTAVAECARVSGVKIFLAVHAYDCYFADWVRPEVTVAQISALCTDRGGTNAEPAFRAVREAKGKFDQCVYLTDGEIGEYPSKPENAKNMIVGILGNRPANYRAKVPEIWREVAVEIE